MAFLAPTSGSSQPPVTPAQEISHSSSDSISHTHNGTPKIHTYIHLKINLKIMEEWGSENTEQEKMTGLPSGYKLTGIIYL